MGPNLGPQERPKISLRGPKTAAHAVLGSSWALGCPSRVHLGEQDVFGAFKSSPKCQNIDHKMTQLESSFVTIYTVNASRTIQRFTRPFRRVNVQRFTTSTPVTRKVPTQVGPYEVEAAYET